MKRLLIALALILTAALPAIAECSAADKKALEEFDRAWGSATTSGNRAALEQIYASDYMSMTAGGAQNRTEAIDSAVREAQRASQSPQPAVTYDYYIINCTPTTATITHRNVITTTTDGKSNTSYSRSVHVLEKRNGRWQVVSNAGHPLDDRGIIAYLEQEWNDADIRQDTAWFDRHFAENFTDISSRTGKVSRKAESIQDVKNRKETITSEDISDINIRMAGADAAVVTGTFRVVGRGEDNKPFDRRTAYTDVWVKRDGRWQVLSSQGTPITESVR